MAQNVKTPAAVLQELAVKQGVAPPNYKVVSCTQTPGTSDNSFHMVVSVAGIEADGSGSSKKIGKHQAAHNALKKLKEIGIYKPPDDSDCEYKVPSEQQNSPSKGPLNFMSNLQTLCLKNKIPAPEYRELSDEGPSHAKEFTFECKISSIKAEAKGNSKKIAKQLAAEIMLQKINDALPDLIVAEKEKWKKLTDKEAEKVSLNGDKSPHSLTKLMKLKNLTYEDFVEDIKVGTEESLKIILDKLEVSYDIFPFEANPQMAVLTLRMNTPFIITGMGSTYDDSVQNALKQAFTIVNSYLKIEL